MKKSLGLAVMGIISVGGILISGCSPLTSEMVYESGEKNEYGPVEDTVRGGIVRFINQGAPLVRQVRKDDAYRQMYDYCNGKYKIVSQGPERGGDSVSMPMGLGSFSGSMEYWSIKFECVE